MRKRLHKFLCDAAHDPAWQKAFVAAGEIIPDPERPDERQGQASMPRTTSAVVENASIVETTSSSTVAEQGRDDIGRHSDPPKANTAPIMMADDTNPALCSAFVWYAGMKKPMDGFLRRIAESLTVAEAEQLIRARVHSGGDELVVPKGKS